MTDLFIKTLNMSISACWMILALLLIRLMLGKAPKWLFVLLWGLVAVRLLCPVSIESVLSLIPSGQTISPEILLDTTPELETGIPVVSGFVNPVLSVSNTPGIGESVNPLQVTFAIITAIWCVGIAVMLGYAVISYLILRGRVKTAVRLEDNIFQSETVKSPFVLGIFHPKIYLPFTICKQSIIHVITHERSHIRRKDHWWKPIGFVLLSVHWFNPLMWVWYILLCRDIELACDEKVIKDLGTEERADYSAALLFCSVNRHMITACPLAFGEIGVKTRVKSVLSYKKPTIWIVTIALTLLGVTAVCFLTDPVGSSGEPDLSFLNYENAVSLVADRKEVHAIYCPSGQGTSDHTIHVGVVNGDNLAAYLDTRNWMLTTKPKHTLASPGSVEFVIADDYRIQIYQRQGISPRAYAVVTYAEDQRYYSIRNSDYTDAVDLLYAPTIIHTENQWQVTRVGDSYYLTVGCEGVAEIGISTSVSSGSCVNADGTLFRVDEQVWLEQLEGMKALSGVMIQALDEYGNILYLLSLPVEERDQNWTSTMIQYPVDQSVILPTAQWVDGIAFTDLKPNEEVLSDFEIRFENERNSLQYSITWARTGLTLEYGLLSSDGTQYYHSTAKGGEDNGQIDKIPAGSYRLFVRNTDYTGVLAYDNPDLFPYVSFNATGAINIRNP